MAFARSGGPESMGKSRSSPSIGLKKEKDVATKMEDALGYKMRNPNRQPEPEPEAKSARAMRETIPEDFFIDLARQVESHIDKSKFSERLWNPESRDDLRGVESLVSTPVSTPARTRRKNLDSTVSSASPRMMTSRSSPELDATIRIPAQSSRFDNRSVASSQRSQGKSPASQFGQPTIGSMQSEEDVSPLMKSGRLTLMEDLQLNAEASRVNGAENTAGDDEEEIYVPFWERPLESHEDDRRFEIDQAVWRLRMGLRQRFGTAEKAWEVIERSAVNGANTQAQDSAPRPEKMLSFAEIKIGLSRIGLKIPHVTGFVNILALLNALDKDGTRNLTFLELMGDDNDPTLYMAPPPPPKPKWMSDLEQPLWKMDWHQRYFDREMQEHIITCDYHRPTKERFRPPKPPAHPEGYKPIWQKYKEVQDEHNHNREKASRIKKAKDVEGCTFKPDIEDSLRTAKVILAERRKRASSQPIRSIHQKNYEKIIEHRLAEEKLCTFHPEVCKRSNVIYENIIDTGDPWWERLGDKDRHDRMNHVAFMEHRDQELLPFRPDVGETKGYKMRRDITRSVHERLYHHEKHEYWHGDERGFGADAVQSAVTWRSQPSSRSPSPAVGSKATPSNTPRLAPSEQAGDRPGEVTVEYRQPLLGLMEACERWGVDANEETTWDQTQRTPSGSRTPNLGKNTPSKRRGPFDNLQESSTLTKAPDGAKAARETSASGTPSAKAKAASRSGTPPRSTGRSQPAARSKTPPPRR